MINRRSAAFLSLLITGINPAVCGEKMQDISHLDTTIGEFVRASGEANARYDVKIDPPDERLKLPLCAESLQVFLPPGHRLLGATLVGVRCNTSRSWVIYLSTHIKLYRKVVLLSNAVARGARVERRDIVLSERDIGNLNTGYFVDAAQVVGKLAKRPLAPGLVLTPLQLTVPRWVTRGEIITLLIEVGGLQVRAQGQALADGRENDRVKARNILSGKIVDGIVSGPGTVRLHL